MSKELSLNNKQVSFLKLLDELAVSLNEESASWKLISGFLKKKFLSKGVYLYGPVGRGKTMLMYEFFKKIFIKKEEVHFQKFMQELHRKIHKFRLNSNQDQSKVIEYLANEIAERTKILCVDEFEIKDITDAMLVMRLFSFLSVKKVFIFLTTNISPDNLYQDGLQRELFLPFISYIKESFMILNLDEGEDYRLAGISEVKNRIIFPVNEKNKTSFKKVKDKLCNNNELYPGEFKVFGRKIIFPRTHQNVLFTNFDELFVQNFGYGDYVSLCRRFTIIVLENVRKISENETDIVTRFINFIDNIYFYKVHLFALLETDPASLYSSGKRSAEFQRTISRLNEISCSKFG